jgi:hypothetical protein
MSNAGAGRPGRASSRVTIADFFLPKREVSISIVVLSGLFDVEHPGEEGNAE